MLIRIEDNWVQYSVWGKYNKCTIPVKAELIIPQKAEVAKKASKFQTTTSPKGAEHGNSKVNYSTKDRMQTLSNCDVDLARKTENCPYHTQFQGSIYAF